MMEPGLAEDSVTEGASARLALQRNLRRLSWGFQHKVRRQQAAGQLRSDLDPRVVSLALVGIAVLAGALPVLRGTTQSAGRVADAQVLSLFLDGVRPRLQ